MAAPRIDALVSLLTPKLGPVEAKAEANRLDVTGDQQLQAHELEAATVEASKGTTAAGRAIKDLFAAGRQTTALGSPQAQLQLSRWLKVEEAISSIDAAQLKADTTRLCQPDFEWREIGTAGFDKAADWVAGQMKAAGLEPLGDMAGGERSYFHNFAWEQSFHANNEVAVSKNVVGRLPGKGPEPRPTIVVMGHLDNLSFEEKRWYAREKGWDYPTYEGANDNAASVATVLSIAKALSQLGDLQADVVFFVPSAEEEGLKGTEAWFNQLPVERDRFIGCVNFELLGKNSLDQLLLFGGNTETEAQANPLYRRAFKHADLSGTTLKPGLPQDEGNRWWQRSDHHVAHLAGVPSIMLHGYTDPDYHRASDTVDKLDFHKVQTAARLAARVIRELADDPAPDETNQKPAADLNPTYRGKVWSSLDKAPL